jgi:membrane associated rhomboid family serine protease
LTHQFDLWAYPLIFVSLLALAAQARTSWAWSGSYAVIYLVVLLLAIAGIAIGAPLPFSIVGWLCIIAFIMVPSVVLSRISSNMLVLDVDSSERNIRRLRWLVIGQRYQYWKDVTEAFALYVKGQGEEADAVLTKWEDQRGIPKSVKEQIKSFKLSGRIVLWDWTAIIEQFQKIKASGKVPRAVYISVSRAYAELGRIHEAAQCLIDAKVSESASNPQSLALSFLPFFSLAGALAEVEKLLHTLSRGRRSFPEFSRLYWRGRCLAVRGEIDEADLCFSRATQLIEQLPGKQTIAAWKARIDSHVKLMRQSAGTEARDAASKQTNTEGESANGTDSDIKNVWRAYENACFVQEIISPGKQSKTVLAIVIVTTVILAIGRILTIFGDDTQLDFVKNVISDGLLDPAKVLAGQYWRLITYMFLHKDETHLFVNMVGLLWFGRIAQNIYGTMRFVFLFFVAGIVAGVVHCLLDPQTLAIGDSGAVMGVFGAVGIGIYRLREYLPASVRRTELSWLIGLAVGGTVIDRMMPQVASIIHLGGLAAGIIFGLLISVPVPKYERISGAGDQLGL